MSFEQGLSGLNAASKTLEAIGNNVANANTVGFKQSQVQFSDLYANSLTGASSGQIGIGTKISQVEQQFTQGNVTASNNPLDIAINGSGFFRMDNSGTVTYGRNGQFQLDKSGFIVNANGARLTGYTADAKGVLSKGAPADLNINTADLAPQVTTGVNQLLNLDSRATAIASTFDTADTTTFNNATSISVFDSLGNDHVLQTFYVKRSAGSWDVYGTSDSTPIGYTPPAAPVALGTIKFATDGTIDTTTTTLPFTASIPVTTGAATPLSIDLQYTGTTQYGSIFGVNGQTQDGYASGRLASFSAGADGLITGRYTNGKSATLGQIVLANFTNPNGLQPLGNNVWTDTAASGAALVSTPNSGSLGVLQSSAVEDSNVDLTAELVNMITAQRVYQANAQTIKTQDQVLQTLVNLR
jgi:flagellar hook protein FlgE